MARRLAAILAADVVGYSRLMAEDETGTLAELKALRSELFDPATARHGGRIVKLMGDGALVEFPSVVEAVECAVAVQQALADRAGRLTLRIGINLGDVIIDGDDIYGDGVNVAARLETLADAGGICLSSVVHESLGSRVDARFVDTGEHQVKNIARPIRVWRWLGAHEAQDRQKTPLPKTALALPDKPSIAVLPFANMSSDADQEFFADGISEDLITELSRFRSLFVISRSSSFTFKGQALNLKQVSEQLGVRYIVEGSVRRAANRLRITAQLIDAVDDTHLWAERYDRDLEDIFAVQDEVVRAIVLAIEPQLLTSERNRALRKPPESLDAWENYQRGLWHMFRYRAEERDVALGFFERAIELDPRFAAAYAGIGYTLYTHLLLGNTRDRDADLERSLKASRTAVSLDEHEPFGHVALARGFWLQGRHEAAMHESEKALQLNPSYALAHFSLGHSLWHQGRAEEAVPPLDEAIRLSPHDPIMSSYLASKAIALMLKGELEEAIACSRFAQQQNNPTIFCHVAEICALGLLERQEEAADAVTRALRVMPSATVHHLDTVLPITHAASHDKFLKGLRAAGMPD